ncbi:tRNA pseudouridine(38-40) synthase TruA [Selenomonas sp. TAMA-11512]|uniref:tRNA pseudouridine(38-40) synthase TruA n=1 Tax=Selenomonas sp. TAMA-11512 TaxID=3095337 RepID=UPI00308F76B7|nr:tRNA pseudouridine(38-40) synthase TruA [Selenomonas sp. TAMA-11512]
MRAEHIEMMKARARNIVLRVAYDGTDYHGFQRQSPPVTAVANVLEEKLALVFNDSIELAAAGRTDSGVHAAGQVVNFFTDGRIPIERVPMAVNSLLPKDISIREAWEAGRDFSARHSVVSKAYTYRVQQGRTPDPLAVRYAWHVRQPLDVESMQKAAAFLAGEQDFSAFRAAGGADMSPVRNMFEARIEAGSCGMIEMYFHANGFLYHMVRNIVGTLVHVGQGRKSVEDFARILSSRDRQQASPTAPAAGLILEKVWY